MKIKRSGLEVFGILAAVFLVIGIVTQSGCETNSVDTPKSISGVKQASAHVDTDVDGFTIEQKNIQNRLLVDNKPGSIKHLYLVSPFNGRQIYYSTVKGKVTSSGKRLSPKTINWRFNPHPGMPNNGSPFILNGEWAETQEIIQDDGTYGDSSEYLYFWNENGQYIQLYVGGLAVIISDQPVAFQDVVIRTEKE